MQVLAAILGFLGVAFGAFGAHILKQKLSPELFNAYQTGVLYHLLHAVAMLALGQKFQTAGWLFALGIVLFSGSLYGLSMFEWKFLGPITPLGGVAFLAGWAWVAVAAAK